ncbi:hypothetical protein C8Q76DRAFT_769461 [Earliella scabrosa]|nr:hypothetical protein C8Q76DRAFT_769461 [Earliella scabrosa]
MACRCNLCSLSFPTDSAYADHNVDVHRFPKTAPPPSNVNYHPFIDARPCNLEGEYLPPGTPPPPRENAPDWWPFKNRPHFRMAEWNFEKVQTSQGDVDELLRNLAAQKALETGDPSATTMYKNAQEMLDTIDAIPYGDVAWTTFHIKYTGPVTPNTPAWKLKTYEIHTRNPLEVAEHIAGCADFINGWDYTPFEETTAEDCQRFSNLMSGTWAWKKADLLSTNAAYHGTMLTPVIIGADKTTVSVATGHQEFHPVYMSLGNLSNDMRRAHRDSVVPLAFLAIPKYGREKATDEYRVFVKQLYHTALAQILSPLRPAMTNPHVMRCPDGHYRRALFELGPVIADYPEQVCLAGIVSGWCPKCRARPHELATGGRPRFRAWSEGAQETFSPAVLWDVYGINGDVTPFTAHFPRADIHELLTPDLLHQLIKGTFKDHLVAWVNEYIKLTAPTEAEAVRIIDEIDRRLYIAPPFPGLRRFPHGRNFSQWTGDDSKALMKIYLAAIAGVVPARMVQCIAAFLDFCYLARRSEHDTISLASMSGALAQFHALRVIFIETGVCPDGFGQPRQHSLIHYAESIQKFGSPNGLCSSITESKHIDAVKRTWRRSNRNNPIGQMLRSLTRLSKMAAARVEFGLRGMLHGDVHTAARQELGDPEVEDVQTQREEAFLYSRIDLLALELDVPDLHTLIRRFLQTRIYPDIDPNVVPTFDLPEISSKAQIGIHLSASVTFCAPSELAGPHGMHREIIRCNPRWYKTTRRFDTVLILADPDAHGMRRYRVARLRQLVSIMHEDILHQVAIVHQYVYEGAEPDGLTAMWVVKPETVNERWVTGIVPLTAIARACHLMPVLGRTSVPVWFDYSDTLDWFDKYYVNHYIDYHAHETLM